MVENEMKVEGAVWNEAGEESRLERSTGDGKGAVDCTTARKENIGGLWEVKARKKENVEDG